jgi:hypothetical protein
MRKKFDKMAVFEDQNGALWYYSEYSRGVALFFIQLQALKPENSISKKKKQKKRGKNIVVKNGVIESISGVKQ